jgi:hypothetical protein
MRRRIASTGLAGKHPVWSAKEIKTLKDNRHRGYAVCRKLLPRRSYYGIRAKAQSLNLCAKRHVWTGRDLGIARKLLADGKSIRQVACTLGLTTHGVKGALRHYRLLVPLRPLVTAHEPLLDAIRQRARALNITLVDLDRELSRRRKAFQKGPAQRVSPSSLLKAISFLGGRVEVRWEPLR